MPGPLHAPNVLFLYPFRFRDPVSGKWHVITERYAEWEIIGAPELRGSVGTAFSPWR
jgi:hypothetical protein